MVKRGWFNESQRHRLAGKGIKSGRINKRYKPNKVTKKYGTVGSKKINNMVEEFNLGSDNDQDWEKGRDEIKKAWNNLSYKEKEESKLYLSEDAIWMLNGNESPKEYPENFYTTYQREESLAEEINTKLKDHEKVKDLEWEIDDMKQYMAMLSNPEKREFKEFVKDKYPYTFKAMGWKIPNKDITTWNDVEGRSSTDITDDNGNEIVIDKLKNGSGYVNAFNKNNKRGIGIEVKPKEMVKLKENLSPDVDGYSIIYISSNDMNNTLKRKDFKSRNIRDTWLKNNKDKVDIIDSM
jgi:hypothetical protein